MKIDFIDINQASTISGKSIQTIRRAIKAKKILAKKTKTPQGFNYFISKKSVLQFFGQQRGSELKKIPVENLTSQTVENVQEKPSLPSLNNEKFHELKELKRMVQSFMTQYQKEREQMVNAFRELQDRLFVAENQVRLLSAPKKKWFQFWK